MVICDVPGNTRPVTILYCPSELAELYDLGLLARLHKQQHFYVLVAFLFHYLTNDSIDLLLFVTTRHTNRVTSIHVELDYLRAETVACRLRR